MPKTKYQNHKLEQKTSQNELRSEPNFDLKKTNQSSEEIYQKQKQD